jgi:tricorn protease-like protein
MGSARFSPDGSRVAFALAAGDPSAEQGWIAVSDGASGSSKLVLTSEAGSFDSVIGWLDDQTLLVQVNAISCSSGCSNEILMVGADGSNPTKVSEGTFLAVVDNQ